MVFVMIIQIIIFLHYGNNETTKISKLILKELSDIFQREIKTHGGIMITVTKVNVTTDLSYARVYLSIFGPEKTLKKRSGGSQQDD